MHMQSPTHANVAPPTECAQPTSRATPGRQLRKALQDGLRSAFPSLDFCGTVEDAFWKLAVHFDVPADVSVLNTHGKARVLHRLVHRRRGDDLAFNFVAYTLKELKAQHGRRLHSVEHQKFRAVSVERRRAEVRDRAIIERSLSLPVSKIAGQAEHLAVLAGLPDAAFRRTPEWRRTRYQALEMARSACAHCGRGPKDGAVLEARHIVSRIAAPARAFDLFNIRVACLDCATGKRTLVASKAGLPDQDRTHRR